MLKKAENPSSVSSPQRKLRPFFCSSSPQRRSRICLRKENRIDKNRIFNAQIYPIKGQLKHYIQFDNALCKTNKIVMYECN